MTGPDPRHHAERPDRARMRPAAWTFLAVVVAVAVALLTSAWLMSRPASVEPPAGGSSRCTLSAKLVPSCGMLWGAVPQAYAGVDPRRGVAAFESSTHTRIDVYHAYHRGPQLFPTAAERAVADDPQHPRLLMMNYKPAMDRTWRQIADGAVDARLERLAAYIKQHYDKPFFLDIWHEPENDVNPAPGSGMTATDYRDMFRHVVHRLRADGADKLVFVMNYQGYPGFTAAPWYNQLYPGDGVVDWIASDSYNSGNASGWNSGDFADMVNRTRGSWDGFYNYFSKTHPDKPLMLAEWGVFAHQPEQQSRFFNSVRAQLPRYPRLKAMLYFDSTMAPGGSTSFARSPAAIRAYQKLANSVRRPDLSLDGG